MFSLNLSLYIGLIAFLDPKVLAMQINQIYESRLQLQYKESGINHENSIKTKENGKFSFQMDHFN